MINLKEYARFWEDVRRRVPAVKSTCFVTLEANIADKVMRIRGEQTPTLFFLAPSAELSGNVDSATARNRCAVMVLEKYSSTTDTAADVLVRTQPVAEDVVGELEELNRCVCEDMQPELSSVNIMPETELLAGWAGWSILFTIDTR